MMHFDTTIINSGEEIHGVMGEMVNAKIRHFQEIFGDYWEDVCKKSPFLAENECVLVAWYGFSAAGWVHYQKRPYSLKFRDFYVNPEFRGQRVASLLFSRLTDIGLSHHHRLITTGVKEDDVRIMFLQSLTYPDGEGAEEVFAFGKFLRKMGFVPCHFNKSSLSPEEEESIRAYEARYPGLSEKLRVFKKKILDGGVELKNSTKAELRLLSPDERTLVLSGLDWKIGHYAQSGRVSYRYDLCPICAYVGSSVENSENCQKCMIRQMCFEPWRDVKNFKEDYEVSAAYFQAVKDYLLSIQPTK